MHVGWYLSARGRQARTRAAVKLTADEEQERAKDSAPSSPLQHNQLFMVPRPSIDQYTIYFAECIGLAEAGRRWTGRCAAERRQTRKPRTAARSAAGAGVSTHKKMKTKHRQGNMIHPVKACKALNSGVPSLSLAARVRPDCRNSNSRRAQGEGKRVALSCTERAVFY